MSHFLHIMSTEVHHSTQSYTNILIIPQSTDRGGLWCLHLIKGHTCTHTLHPIDKGQPFARSTSCPKCVPHPLSCARPSMRVTSPMTGGSEGGGVTCNKLRQHTVLAEVGPVCCTSKANLGTWQTESISLSENFTFSLNSRVRGYVSFNKITST